MSNQKTVHLDQLEAGPPKDTLLFNISAFPDHGGKDISFQKEDKLTKILLQKSDDQIYAYLNNCPHAGTPLNMLNDKFLDFSGSQLLCKTHGARFRISDGECVSGPCKGDYLTPVAIRVEGDFIYSA